MIRLIILNAKSHGNGFIYDIICAVSISNVQKEIILVHNLFSYQIIVKSIMENVWINEY